MGGHDKIPIISEKKYKFEGVFDIKETYPLFKKYLEGSRHYDVSEKDYGEKNVGGEREITSKNEAEQEYTDYYKIILRYVFEAKGKDIEVEINGKKRTMVQGIAVLTINAYIEPDFLGKRSTTPLMTFVSKVYDKFISKDELTQCIGSASGDVEGLIAVFKRQMNSYTQ